MAECVICGSDKAREEKTTWVVKEPHGSVEHFTFTTIMCPDCGEDIMGDDYDSVAIPAMERSKKSSVINMLKFFEENDVRKSCLERIFGIRFGAIDKYLEADVVEPSFVMLLLTYRTYFPELLTAADLTRKEGGFNRCELFGDENSKEKE